MGFAARLYEAVFARSLIRTDILSAAITAVAPALYWLAGRTVPDDLTLLISIWVAVTVSGVLLARLITAPYRIWKEDQRAISQMKSALDSPKQRERDRIADILARDKIRLTEKITAIRRALIQKDVSLEERKKAFHGAEKYTDKLWYDDVFRRVWMDFYDAANTLYKFEARLDEETRQDFVTVVKREGFQRGLDKKAGVVIEYVLHDKAPPDDGEPKNTT